MELHIFTFLLGVLGHVAFVGVHFFLLGGFDIFDESQNINRLGTLASRVVGHTTTKLPMSVVYWFTPPDPKWNDFVVLYANVAILILGLPGFVQWIFGFYCPVGCLRMPSGCDDTKNELSDFEFERLMSDDCQEKKLLVFRVVTRGDCPELVAAVCEKNFEILSLALNNHSHFDWTIEVVTDRKCLNLLVEEDKIREIVVPVNFVSHKGTLYKARALHYANSVSELSLENFLVHLDEETILSTESIFGICDFVNRRPNDIGQGVIVYGQDTIVNPFLTLADSVRVADDYCRFRICLFIGKPLQGIHGSFVVVRVGVEKLISFDVGPEGSITEDATFALMASEAGVAFGWVHGVMLEKSPFTVIDFLKQRRRWIQGLWLTVTRKWISWKVKFLLALSVFSWSTVVVSPIIFLLLRFVQSGHRLPAIVVVLRSLTVGTVTWVYVFGAIHNFSIRQLGVVKYVGLVCLAYLLCPVFWILECAAVVLALTTPFGGFHVVDKSIK